MGCHAMSFRCPGSDLLWIQNKTAKNINKILGFHFADYLLPSEDSNVCATERVGCSGWTCQRYLGHTRIQHCRLGKVWIHLYEELNLLTLYTRISAKNGFGITESTNVIPQRCSSKNRDPLKHLSPHLFEIFRNGKRFRSRSPILLVDCCWVCVVLFFIMPPFLWPYLIKSILWNRFLLLLLSRVGSGGTHTYTLLGLIWKAQTGHHQQAVMALSTCPTISNLRTHIKCTARLFERNKVESNNLAWHW